MRINGTKVLKSRVTITDVGWDVVLYGQSPRGTPIMLGELKTDKVKMEADLKAAPEKLAKKPLP